MRNIIPGLLIILAGIAVFYLPYWLPLVADAHTTPETFDRAGQIGGGLVGLGVVVCAMTLFLRKRSG